MGVSRMFLQCFSKVFHECFMNVSKLFVCMKSSQLPRHIEGLFSSGVCGACRVKPNHRLSCGSVGVLTIERKVETLESVLS